MKRNDAIMRVRQVLLKRRDALRKSVSGQFSLPKRDENQAVGDEVDAAVESAHDELVSQLVAAESRELQRIDVALERIRRGEYGVCEGCSKNIPLARLQAVPYATLCVKCQRELEVTGQFEGETLQPGAQVFDDLGLDITDDVLS